LPWARNNLGQTVANRRAAQVLVDALAGTVGHGDDADANGHGNLRLAAPSGAPSLSIFFTPKALDHKAQGRAAHPGSLGRITAYPEGVPSASPTRNVHPIPGRTFSTSVEVPPEMSRCDDDPLG